MFGLVLCDCDALPVRFSFQHSSAFGLDRPSAIARTCPFRACICLLFLYRACRWKNNRTELCFFFSSGRAACTDPGAVASSAALQECWVNVDQTPDPSIHLPARTSLTPNCHFTYKHPSHIFRGIHLGYKLAVCPMNRWHFHLPLVDLYNLVKSSTPVPTLRSWNLIQRGQILSRTIAQRGSCK